MRITLEYLSRTIELPINPEVIEERRKEKGETNGY